MQVISLLEQVVDRCLQLLDMLSVSLATQAAAKLRLKLVETCLQSCNLNPILGFDLFECFLLYGSHVLAFDGGIAFGLSLNHLNLV